MELESSLTEIKNLIKNGHYFDSIDTIAKTSSKYPDNPELKELLMASYYKLGCSYLDLNDLDKALNTFKTAISIDKDHPDAYNGLGRAYFLKERYNDAINAYIIATEKDKKDVFSLNSLGNTYRQVKRFDKAIDTFNKAIDIDPDFDGAYYNRGFVYEEKGEYKKAQSDFEQKIKLTKNNPDYFTRVAENKVSELKRLLEITDYSSIRDLVESIKKTLLFTDDCVTHYTSLSTARKLIVDKSPFQLSEGAFLNDTSEGRELFKYLGTLNANVHLSDDTDAQPFTQRPFIGSFVSEYKHDDLALWRMYGKENKEEARGCAITLDREKFIQCISEELKTNQKNADSPYEEEFSFYRVSYRTHDTNRTFIIPGAEEKEKELNENMRQLLKLIETFKNNTNRTSDFQNVIELLNSIGYLFKSAEYQYEHELRLVVKGVGFLKNFSVNPDFPRVYISLVDIVPLTRKITLGPKIDKKDEWASMFYYSLEKDGYRPGILISHLPYK